MVVDRGGFVSDTDRRALEQFPTFVEDPASYFTLLADDLELVMARYGSAARLAGGLQIGAMRLLGFVPFDLTTAPSDVVGFVAEQIGVGAANLADYSTRDQTRSDHVADVERLLGFRRADQGDLKSLGDWLVERALEHDRPSVLFRLACEHLRSEQIVRPAVTTVERAVVSARQRATNETYIRLAPQLDQQRRNRLSDLLVVDSDLGVTPWIWLRRQAPTAAPGSIKEQIAKIDLLREVGADQLDLTMLNPNRVRHLASVGNRSTAQAVQRLAPERRYQILAATVASTLMDRTDEVLDLFDISIAGIERSARTRHAEAKTAMADVAIDTVRVFNQIAQIVTDPDVSDADVRSTIMRHVGAERFEQTMERASGIDVAGDAYLSLVSRRYTQLRKFAPLLLSTFSFHAADDTNLLEALDALRELNDAGTRLLPADAPIGFASKRWRRHMLDDGRIDRHAWEMCLLIELRGTLRGANVWVDHSRRYRNPSDYLLQTERWERLRPEFTASTGISLDPNVRLDELDGEINGHLEQLDTVLEGAESVRIDDGKLVVPPLSAEELPPGTEELKDLVDGLMPHIDLVDLVVEVDSWTDFRSTLTHVDNATTRSENHPERLLAGIVAHGCNFGIDTMARIAGFSADELAWTNTWYLRTETVRAANDCIVNHQTALPIAEEWGTGTLSSSDGQRFPVTVNTPRARHHRKYFTGTGATIYTWTSDRHAQYGTRVIPTTVREATYVLDAIFDNETDLEIEEHTTDTAGYTDLVYGLFDLTGLRFSPRIRDLADQRLWRLPTTPTGTPAADLLRHPIRTERITARWDDMLPRRCDHPPRLPPRVRPRRPAPSLGSTEPPHPSHPGIRSDRQDHLDPALPRQPRPPSPNSRAAQQRRDSPRASPGVVLRQSRSAAATRHRRPRPPRRVPDAAHQRHRVLEHRVHQRHDRPPSRHRPPDHRRTDSAPVTDDSRSRQPVRSIRLPHPNGAHVGQPQTATNLKPLSFVHLLRAPPI